jgi:hypothetical protein
MRASTRKPQRQRLAGRGLRRRRDGDSVEAHERPVAEAEPQERGREPNGPENRERRTGGPQDQALYVCRCGSAFQAVVTASVSCPHCGDPQTW